MDVITVIGSDRITLGMFNSFMKSTFWKNVSYKIVDINCLLDSTMQASQFEDVLKTSKIALFRYFLEKKFVLNLPQVFTDKSDLILQFAYGATSPTILKDRESLGISVKERWDTNINRIASQR